MSEPNVPVGTVYPNHEALSFAVHEAAGQFTILGLGVVLLGLASAVLAVSPRLSTIENPLFLAVAGLGLTVALALGGVLAVGIAHAPRALRLGADGIVAYRTRASEVARTQGYDVPYAAIVGLEARRWEVERAGKSTWYEFHPPQVRFTRTEVPKRYRANRRDPSVGVLYLTEANLERVRTALGGSRDRDRSGSGSALSLENDMDDTTAAALGEV
jgi:hypothetical protein